MLGSLVVHDMRRCGPEPLLPPDVFYSIPHGKYLTIS